MSIQIYSLASAVFLLAGCASSPDTKTEAEAAATPVVQAASKEQDAEGSLPEIEVEKQYAKLSPDLLFMVLTAEIAGQRGNINLALEGYLQALKISQDPAIAERATQIALFAKNIDKASETVNQWISSDPDSEVAQKIATMVALQQGDGVAAAAHLKTLLASENVDAEETMLEVVKVLGNSNVDALAVMQSIVAEMPEQAEAHYAYALLASDRNEPEIARDEVNRALELRPDWVKGKVLLVQILSDAGEVDQARHLLARALSDNSDNILLRLIYAQLLVKSGDYLAAEKEFERILEEEPEQQDARYALALVKLQVGKQGQAKTLFLELLDVAKWQKQAYLSLGRLAQDSGDYVTALAWYDRIPPGPLFLDAQMGSMQVLVAQGRFPAALDRLQELRNKFPAQSVRLYLMEVELLNEEKNYEGAFETLNDALRELPGRPELLYARALAAERIDRLDVLESDLKQVLLESPNDPHALNALGYTLVDRTDRYSEAEKYLEQAIALRPDDPVIIDSYGWLKFRQGRNQEALELLRRAYELRQDPEIAIHLVEVLWVLDRKQAARDVFAEASEAFPGSEYLQEITRRLPQLTE